MKTKSKTNQSNSKGFTKAHLALALWYFAVTCLAAYLAVNHVNSLMQQLN